MKWDLFKLTDFENAPNIEKNCSFPLLLPLPPWILLLSLLRLLLNCSLYTNITSVAHGKLRGIVGLLSSLQILFWKGLLLWQCGVSGVQPYVLPVILRTWNFALCFGMLMITLGQKFVQFCQLGSELWENVFFLERLWKTRGLGKYNSFFHSYTSVFSPLSKVISDIKGRL